MKKLFLFLTNITLLLGCLAGTISAQALENNSEIKSLSESAAKFLQAWVIENNSEKYHLFISNDILNCVDSENTDEKSQIQDFLDESATVFKEYAKKRKYKLSKLITSNQLWNTDNQTLHQHYNSKLFTIFSSKEYLRSNCNGKSLEAYQSKHKDFENEIFWTVFSINFKEIKLEGFMFLWGKENGKWKIISFHSEN